MNLLSSIESFQFGETVHPRGGQFGPILKSQLEFIILHSGAGTVSVDGVEHELVAGYAALVLNHEHLAYRYHGDGDTRVTWCEAVGGRPSAALAARLRGGPIALPVSRRMLELQKIGVDLEDGGGADHQGLSRALGVAVCREFLYQAARHQRERPIHRAVLRARTHIEENHANPCDLKTIARAAHVTPQYLTRLFKHELGQTPIQYLWSLRAKKGAQLLRRSGLSVAEVAYRSGYENPNHFSRHIRENFGVPPTELRRRRWQATE